jgi:hypothetical protein
MIGPGGLLLVVPTYMQFQLQFIGGVAEKKKKLNLDIIQSDILSTGGDALRSGKEFDFNQHVQHL